MGLLGVAVIRYVTVQFGHRVLSRLAASQSPGPVLADGAMLFIAGILLILPGIISDIAGLLLLIPLVPRLTVGWLRRRLIRHAETVHARFVHSRLTDNPRPGEVTLEGHVVEDEPAEDDGRPG